MGAIEMVFGSRLGWGMPIFEAHPFVMGFIRHLIGTRAQRRQARLILAMEVVFAFPWNPFVQTAHNQLPQLIRIAR